MTVIGLDDTDSRTAGMCTTYLAAQLAEAIGDAGGHVERTLLVRLCPAVEHKTRGNAALAVHTDLDPETAVSLASELVEEYAVGSDPRTSPGVVVAPTEPDAVPQAVGEFARRAVRERVSLAEALALAADHGFATRGWSSGKADETMENEEADGTDPDTDDVVGRGRIGALAATGAWRGLEGWTYEHISYRAFDRCGTPRSVDEASVFAAAEEGYPEVWDTVDRGEDEAVCVPNAPGPILHGIRGDDPEAVRRVAAAIESEPVERAATFVTNQGTDAHLRDYDGPLDALRDGRAYRVDATVVESPETRRGGHVFLAVGRPDESETEPGPNAGSARDTTDSNRLTCVAFEPTKRFRDRVRALRVGDRLTVCGEVGEGTLKLEKFAVRELVHTEPATPTCPDCGRSMKSAGANQGYRCRDCGTSAPETVERSVERELERGWYEVPPCARRHIAKPLIRGGFDAPTRPER